MRATNAISPEPLAGRTPAFKPNRTPKYASATRSRRASIELFHDISDDSMNLCADIALKYY